MTLTLEQAMAEERERLGVTRPDPWEKLEVIEGEDIDCMTFRMKVPGGWLYRYGLQGYCWTPVVVFVKEMERA